MTQDTSHPELHAALVEAMSAELGKPPLETQQPPLLDRLADAAIRSFLAFDEDEAIRRASAALKRHEDRRKDFAKGIPYTWLIEHGASPTNAPLYHARGGWTRDPHAASRFESRDLADEVALTLRDDNPDVSLPHRVCQHGFDGKLPDREVTATMFETREGLDPETSSKQKRSFLVGVCSSLKVGKSCAVGCKILADAYGKPDALLLSNDLIVRWGQERSYDFQWVPEVAHYRVTRTS